MAVGITILIQMPSRHVPLVSRLLGHRITQLRAEQYRGGAGLQACIAAAVRTSAAEAAPKHRVNAALKRTQNQNRPNITSGAPAVSIAEPGRRYRKGHKHSKPAHHDWPITFTPKSAA